MKIKNADIDALLKNSLRITETPSADLVQQVKDNLTKEDTVLKKPMMKRSFSTAAAVLLAVLLISGSAFATWYLLKPGEVAQKFENRALSAAFDSETALNINASLSSGGYTFTLLAMVSGRDITDHPVYSNGEMLRGRTYAVVAIQKADGSPMPSPADDDYGNPSFYVSPYVKGLKPWQVNAHTMSGGYLEMETEGVQYRIIDCDEITMFADRGLYLGINTGSFYDTQAFNLNEATGELTANPDYDGASVVFSLPIDPALADPQKARQYLDDLWADAHSGARSGADNTPPTDGGAATFEIQEDEANGITIIEK